VLALVEAILRDPCQGLGKPEPLKYLDTGVWSCRLTQAHRLVYLDVHFVNPVPVCFGHDNG
jgi:toxin YoeB